MQAEKQLEVLFQISRALVGKQNLDQILVQIVTMTAGLVDSKICSLMLLNEKKTELLIMATQSLSPVYREKGPIKVGQSVGGRVVATGQPIQVADVTKDPRYGFPEIARQEGLRSLLSVPLTVGEEAIGVLNCYTESERVFKKSEIQLVQTLSSHAAMAIKHMRVVKEEAEARLALETQKFVHSAKRILMKKYGMSEHEAHRYIQKMSMDKNKPQKEIAEAILIAADLNGHAA